MKQLLLALGMVLLVGKGWSQPVPAIDENIPFLITFGSEAIPAWGDDDHCQIFFFTVPKSHTTPFYIRVYDPGTGGKHDEARSSFNTKTKFTVYGAGSYSNKDVENKDPVGAYKKGNMLFTKTFGNESDYDGKWYSFGPINPLEGHLKSELGGFVFKLITEGLSGDDGNMYRYFLSSKREQNIPIEGGNAFTYEYSFRLNSSPNQISHIYPYVEDKTIAVKQHNFDFDGDADIKIISMSSHGFRVKTSEDGKWTDSEHPIKPKDLKTCLDVQIIKTGTQKNNNVVFYLTNQFGDFMPFHAVPIGAIPKKSLSVTPKDH